MPFEREVKELARSLGADLVGIVSTDSIYLKDNRTNINVLLPGVVKFGLKAIGLKEEELKAHVGSPILWELWQNLLIGNLNNCFECINACPVGKN